MESLGLTTRKPNMARPRRLAIDDGVLSHRIHLSEEEALQLELALNLSKYGHAWNDIGDCLFYFHTRRHARKLTVAPTQLRVLRRLLRARYRRDEMEENENPQEAP